MISEKRIKKIMPYFIVFSVFVVIEIVLSFKSQGNATIYSHSYYEEITLVDIKSNESKIILFFKDHKDEILESSISKCKLDVDIGDAIKLNIIEETRKNGDIFKSPFDVRKSVCYE